MSDQQPALAGQRVRNNARQISGRPSPARAHLASLPDDNKSPTPRLAEAYTLRLQAYKAFAAVAELQEGSEFAPGTEAGKHLETGSERMKALLLYLLAIIQHRADLRPDRVPEPLREASARFRTTLANMLDNLSDRLAGRGRTPCGRRAGRARRA